MANKDLARVVLAMEAEVTRLRRDMDKSVDVVQGATNKMERASAKAAKGMEAHMTRAAQKMGGAMKSFATGFLGGLAAGGVAGIVSRLGDVAKGIAEIGDQARRAGVSAQAFQEWKFVAEQNRIGIDAMTDGLKELNLRADEFIQTGKGSAAESFMRLGYGADELKKKLQDPSALLLEIIDRLGKFDKAAQIRISDELFGGSAGERFVELLAQGEEGIRRTIGQAHELGAVMDDDVIAKAAELDKKFNEITTTVATGLKTAIVESATALQDFINTFNKMWADFEARRRAADLGTLAGSLAGTPPGPAPINHTTPKTDRLPKAEWTPPKPPPGGFGSGGGDGRDKAAAQAEREAQAVRKLIDELQEELRLVGATNTEKEISASLRRVNVDATSKEGQQIAALITQINAETEAREKAKQAAEQQKQAVENLFDMGANAIGEMIDGSVKAEDAVKKLAAQLAIAAAQAALLGSGPLAGLFGGGGIIRGIGKLLGFDDGGYTGAGGKYEPAGVVHRGEYVFDAQSVRKAGGPAALDAVRASLKGYASGGFVAPNMPPVRTPTLPPLRAAANQSRPQIIELHVTGNPGPEFIPTIQAHSRDVAVRVTQAGIGQYDKQLNRTLGGKIANVQARQF